MNQNYIYLIYIMVLVGILVSCGESKSSQPRLEVAPLSLKPLDFMTDVTNHQAGLYDALKENSKIESNKKTLAYEGALFRILQTSNGGKYGGAKRLILQYLEKYPDDPKLEFQMGMQLFRLGRFDQAEPYFSKLLQTRDKQLREAAQFFLAAAYSGYDNNEATTILREIVAEKNHSFRANAQTIIDGK